jgi:Flp pilus assembly pilin Flp
VKRAREILADQSGQTTTEYATTLLVVLVMVGALTAFIKGGGMDGLFEGIIDKVLDGIR